jgi:uncharacterized protein
LERQGEPFGPERGQLVHPPQQREGQRLERHDERGELLQRLDPQDITGCVIFVPVVNVLGVQFHSRYLPDRRDLNRCFPGSTTGSTASRIAHTVMTEIVSHADAGVDFHTAANRRTNMPQVRINLDDSRAQELGRAFSAPFLIQAPVRPGSLRDAAEQQGHRSLDAFAVAEHRHAVD